MESSPPFPIEPGERLLAAIIFTDVVNFSARVQAEEVATLSLLEQDVAVMTKYCERYSGWVLKSTGDGLLLYFSSAVHAVNCALQIQQFFLKRTKSTPAGSAPPLTHRVGVHLGDVFVKDHDVMGDGVNIASRLQSVADPGGICISQTVYDVVRNKLDLTVERLSPRDLKNITDVGAIYRVVLEPRTAAAAPVEFHPPAPQARSAFSSTEKWVAALLVIVALAIVARLVMQAHRSQQAALAESQATQVALDSLLAQRKAHPPVAADKTPASAEPAATPVQGDTFAELATNPARRKALGATEREELRQRAVAQVARLIPWVKTAMARYTKESPLFVPRLTASMPAELKVYTEPDGRFVFATGGAARSRDWDELRLVDQEGLIVGALVNSPSTPPPEVLLGADAFAYLHELPEMVAAVRKN